MVFIQFLVHVCIKICIHMVHKSSLLCRRVGGMMEGQKTKERMNRVGKGQGGREEEQGK